MLEPLKPPLVYSITAPYYQWGSQGPYCQIQSLIYLIITRKERERSPKGSQKEECHETPPNETALPPIPLHKSRPPKPFPQQPRHHEQPLSKPQDTLCCSVTLQAVSHPPCKNRRACSSYLSPKSTCLLFSPSFSHSAPPFFVQNLVNRLGVFHHF